MSGNLITRVLRAEQSSDLSEDAGDVDVVRAVGAAGLRRRLGSYLPRFLASDGRDYRQTIIDTVAGALRSEYPKLTETQRVAVATCATYLYLKPRCPACHGRGYELMPDAPKLSDVFCRVCNGSGRNATGEEFKEIRPALGWAQNLIEQSAERYSVAVGRKLGRD